MCVIRQRSNSSVKFHIILTDLLYIDKKGLDYSASLVTMSNEAV